MSSYFTIPLDLRNTSVLGKYKQNNVLTFQDGLRVLLFPSRHLGVCASSVFHNIFTSFTHFLPVIRYCLLPKLYLNFRPPLQLIHKYQLPYLTRLFSSFNSLQFYSFLFFYLSTIQRQKQTVRDDNI